MVVNGEIAGESREQWTRGWTVLYGYYGYLQRRRQTANTGYLRIEKIEAEYARCMCQWVDQSFNTLISKER